MARTGIAPGVTANRLTMTPMPESLFSSRRWRIYLLGLMMGLLAGLCSYQAAGLTLGFFFAAIAMPSLLTPVLAAGQNLWFDRFFVVSGIADGTALILLIAVFTPAITFWQWVQLYLLIIAWVVLLGAAVSLLIHWRISRWIASILVTLGAMLWLTWPLWLARLLTQSMVNQLTAVHPLFSVNALVQERLGLWSEQAGVAYALTNLNQDIPQRLPSTPWPAIAAQLILAAMLLLLIRLTGREGKSG